MKTQTKETVDGLSVAESGETGGHRLGENTLTELWDYMMMIIVDCDF